QLTMEQMEDLAHASGMSLEEPWKRFAESSAAGLLCAEAAQRLRREPIVTSAAPPVPAELPWEYRAVTSTQATLGRFLLDLHRAEPDLAGRVVTVSPDVASSTNLGGWINRTGVWSIANRHDWFGDDSERLLKWQE